jgi:7-cyano-7-deazaguanine synthase in queuosine biosynthesis
MIKIDKDYERVGVLVSGGTASAILLHQVARDARLTNKKVIAVTLVLDNLESIEKYAKKVVIECMRANDIIIEHIIHRIDESKTYIDEYETENFKEITSFLKYDNNIDVYYDGTHMTDTSMPEIVHAKEDNEFLAKAKAQEAIGTIFPYKDLTNVDIAVQYERENILSSLFPLTFSCKSNATDTKEFTQHCLKCWDCKERYWAFKKF